MASIIQGKVTLANVIFRAPTAPVVLETATEKETLLEKSAEKGHNKR